MPAITKFDEITGEIAEIKWLDSVCKRDQPNPLYILLLSEGFMESEKPRFMTFINKLQNEFFRIAPFGYCRPYISFLYCFLPSKTSGLSGPSDEADGTWRRVFRLFIQNGNLRPKVDDHVLRVVYRLKLPYDLLPPPWILPNSASVWFNSRSKSYGAIAVIANTNPVENPDILGGTNFSPLVPEEVTDMAGGIAYWFTIGMNGFDVQPGALHGRYPNVFAHELCHSLNLYDEYEKTTHEYNEPPGAGPIVEYRMGISQNVQQYDHLDATTILETLKWKHLLSSEERSKIRNGDLIYTKEYLVAKGIIPNSDAADRTIHKVDPKTENPLHWSKVFLVEGATYRRKAYRPHFECKMRFDTYDERVTEDPRKYSLIQRGTQTYGSPEFCRVCNYSIRNHITGYSNFGVGGIDRNRLSIVFYDEVMPRVIESFKIWNDVTGSALSVARAFCHIASVRAYIIFRSLPGALRDIKLNITTNHVSLYYNGIICDATFYDLYRLSSGSEESTSSEPNDDSDLYYQVASNEFIPFKNWEINRGFLGTPGELKAYIWSRRMRMGSFGNPANEWPDFLHIGLPSSELSPRVSEIIDFIIINNYGEAQYPGPADPEYDNIERLLGYGNPFIDPMKHEWERWMLYNEIKKSGRSLPNDRSLDYLAPLDISISRQALDSL